MRAVARVRGWYGKARMSWFCVSWWVERRGMMFACLSEVRIEASRVGLWGGVGREMVMSFRARGVVGSGW